MRASSRWGAARMALAAVAIATTGLVSCGGSDPGPDSQPRDQRTDDALALFDAIGENDPFCSAAVLLDEDVVFVDAFGSVDGEPVTPETDVDIASVSKQFTGVAVELLIDDGDLAGSDLVGELVPASSPATDDVSVNELLTRRRPGGLHRAVAGGVR